MATKALVVPQVHDVTILTTRKLARARVMGVPPEEFGIERNARSIRDCNYAFHDIVTKTEGQLIAEGFDEAQIKALPEYAGFDNIETFARDTASENTPGSSSTNTSTQIKKITEHYIRMDYEGNNKPCLYMVITAGNDGQILRKDDEDCIYPIDAIPFAATTPIPVTHRFFGRSIADVTMELQRQKTALKRGMLDNLYLHNAPRPVVAEDRAGPNTIDDILTVRQGAPIRVKTGAGDAIAWQTVPDITGSIYPAMQYIDAELETRTGVSKQTQGIDANALQNQTATAVAQVFSASQMRMKLIARVMAEGVKDIFSLLHGTVRKHGQQAQTVRLRNQWVQVDPRNWKTRDDMTIHVGLGTGDKAQQFTQVMGIANFQKELLMGGKGHMVPDPQLFNTASELVKLTGRKNPDRFFADPSEKNPDGSPKNPPAPPPVPEAVQVAQVKAQTDKDLNNQKAGIEKLQAEADIATQREKTAADIALADKKADLEAQLALLEFAMREREHELKLTELNYKMSAQQQVHNHKMDEAEMGLVTTAASHDMASRQSQEQHEQKMELADKAARAKPKGDK